jgi:phenylalanyl-tRNA synthetase beta chain
LNSSGRKMQFSEAWLRQLVDPQLTTEELAEQLTMSGLEVEGVTPVGDRLEGVVAGVICARAPHPDADRLSVCQVDDGAGGVQVVCGAANARVGLVAPLARPGFVLPDGKRIEATEIRGIASAGMLCSAIELGFAEDADGLMELPADTPAGQSLVQLLALDDQIIDVGLTPNRGDCLSIRGIAREVGVLNGLEWSAPECAAVPAAGTDRVPVSLQAAQACPRYVGRVIRGVNSDVPIPLWMRERLRRGGVRSIHPVVDITNYVMLELGQPMHAFDLARLAGPEIAVRWARSGEFLLLLNGDEVSLSEQTLVIADAAGPVALAGVMGGEASAAGPKTQDVFLESAFFAPSAVAGRARLYRLSSDASHRFERGVDFELAPTAMERATQLVLDICGGRAGPLIEACEPSALPERPTITLRRARIERILGSCPDDSWIETALARLGIRLEVASPGTWRATPPSYRFDITIEADLIEEVARVWGYQRLPTTLPTATMHFRVDNECRRAPGEVRDRLVAHGYFEAITYSFVDQSLQQKLDPETPALELLNPLSADMAVMRTSLWPGLVQALVRNRNRQHERVRLFELGLVFRNAGGALSQEQELGAVAAGPVLPENWNNSREVIQFFDIKGDLEALLAPGKAIEFRPETCPALHPGQSARLLVDNVAAGWVGLMHPQLAAQLDIHGSVAMLAVKLEPLLAEPLPTFKPVSKFPAMRRDISVLLDATVPAAAVLKCVESAAPEYLENLQLFDVYRGEGIDSGKKSLTLGLIFRGSSSTLIDSQVDAAVDAVVHRLKTEFDASLRE